MKKYIAEIIIFCIQLFMFYISPLFAGPTDGMGMVVLILFATLILSILLGSISKNRIYRWYGDGRFNSVRDPDPVHFAWQYFQKQNQICLSGGSGSGFFALCISSL